MKLLCSLGEGRGRGASKIGIVLLLLAAAGFGCILLKLFTKPTCRPTSIGQFFLLPEKQCSIRWFCPFLPFFGRRPRMVVKDYHGTIVRESVGRFEKNVLTAEVCLPEGYYEISFPDAGCSFGLVCSQDARSSADPFFCIDSALSSGVLDPDHRTQLIAILKKGGIAAAGERLTWADINPAAGMWDWETFKHYESLRRSYARAGIRALEIVHDAPAWIRPAISPYPEDLIAAFQSWADIIWRWHGLWEGLQIWVEPETALVGGGLPADQYVPIIKTVAYALFEQGLATPLGGGGFTGF